MKVLATQAIRKYPAWRRTNPSKLVMRVRFPSPAPAAQRHFSSAISSPSHSRLGTTCPVALLPARILVLGDQCAKAGIPRLSKHAGLISEVSDDLELATQRLHVGGKCLDLTPLKLAETRAWLTPMAAATST